MALQASEGACIVPRVNLLALALAATLGRVAPSPSAPAPLRSETYTLDNGLTVVLHRDRTVPLVAVRVLYRVGAADDPPGQQGMVHLLEHALFHGSQHLQGSAKKELSRIGAVHSNGVTTPDFMQLLELVPASNLAATLRLEADRMGFYQFDSMRLGTEKLIVNREMAEVVQRNPWNNVSMAARSRLYDSSHPLHPASAASVATISVSDLEALAATALAPNNAVLALAGDLPADTRDLVERYFADLESKDTSLTERRKQVVLADELRISVDGGNDTSPRVLIVWHAPIAGHADEPTATLAASVLRRRLRDARRNVWRHNANATGGVARYRRGHSFGEFMVGAAASMGSSPSALVEDLDDALARMLTEPPSARELDASAM